MSNRDGIFRHFWEAPYRPLFLVTYVWAFAALAWWPLGNRFGLPLPLFEPVLLWHVHELTFGFSSAAIGGYLLTALPSWTANDPERGTVLKVLLIFWIIARLSVALADVLPLIVLVVAVSLYFLMLSAIIFAQTIQAEAWIKSLFGAAVLALGTGDIAFLVTTKMDRIHDSMAIIHTMLIGLSFLILIIGSRIIPAFTDNWLNRDSTPDQSAKDASLSRSLAIATLAVALAAMLMGLGKLSAFFLVIAGGSALWNMRSWRTLAILKNPLLAGLHMAYFWLPVGLITIGVLSLFSIDYPLSAARHILAIGAMSGLIIAISGRAASHTKNGDMRAGAFLVAGMAFIWAACPIRFAAPIFPDHTTNIETAAAMVWCLGWASCIIGFRPALIGQAARPVLSGPKHKTDNGSQ